MPHLFSVNETEIAFLQSYCTNYKLIQSEHAIISEINTWIKSLNIPLQGFSHQ